MVIAYKLIAFPEPMSLGTYWIEDGDNAGAHAAASAAADVWLRTNGGHVEVVPFCEEDATQVKEAIGDG